MHLCHCFTVLHECPPSLSAFCCSALTAAAFVSAAAYLQLEDAGKRGLLPAADATLSQLAAQHLWPRVPAGLVGQIVRAAQAVVQAWPTAGVWYDYCVASLASQPLLELLPQATFALGGVLAAVWLLQAATRQLRGYDAATAAAQLLLAMLLQVSDRNAPLILLLAALELVAIAKLLASRAATLKAGGGGGRLADEAAVLVALVQVQLFYSTGHLCEFAGLQYTAGE